VYTQGADPRSILGSRFIPNSGYAAPDRVPTIGDPDA